MLPHGGLADPMHCRHFLAGESSNDHQLETRPLLGREHPHGVFRGRSIEVRDKRCLGS
jgi:hypothetical protein